jgi:hypothetical protein
MSSYYDVLSGKFINPAFPQYQFIELTADIELSWPAQFQNVNKVVAVTMVVEPDANGHTITLPDATQCSLGYRFTIKNASAFDFDVEDNAGDTLTTIEAGKIWEFWLDEKEDAAGVWTQVPYISGTAAVSSVAATSVSNNLSITGSPITTSGTFIFDLRKDLLQLASFGASSGIAVRENDSHWYLRTIQGKAGQIDVENGDGVDDDPVISLVNDITGVNTMRVGNLKLELNTISSTNVNGNIILSPEHTGPTDGAIHLDADETHILAGGTLKFFAPTGTNYISFRLGTTSDIQDYQWPTVAPTDGQVLQHQTAGTLVWANVATGGGGTTADAIARYSNTSGSLKNSNVLITDAWDMSGLTSISQVGGIGIANITPQTITTLGPNDDLILAPNGIGVISANGDVAISTAAGTRRKLRLHVGNAASFYAGLVANAAMAANVTWILPAADSAGYFKSDGANNVSITDTLTGLTSATIGNIIISNPANTITTAANQPLTIQPNGTGALTLSTTSSGDLTLSGGATGNIISAGDFQIKPVGGVFKKLRLYNSAGTFFYGLQAPAALASNITLTLPTDDGITGLMSNDGTGNLTFDTGIYAEGAPGYNIGIGDNNFTDSTNSLTITNGDLPTAAVTDALVIQSQDITAGNTSLSWYGEGNGGVGTTADNTATRTVAITVNGTVYYLLARLVA